MDENYAVKFETLARAIWAKDPNIILVVGDFVYGQPIHDPFNFRGAASGITSLAGQQRILRLAKEHGREVWFDLHVGTDGPRPDSTLDGMFSFVDALAKIADGARHKVAVFEFNAGNHTQRRALANALAIQAIERDGRIPIATSANCLQPDGQNDNVGPGTAIPEPGASVAPAARLGHTDGRVAARSAPVVTRRLVQLHSGCRFQEREGSSPA